MELLKLATNVPEEIALKYSDGKEVEGRYGPQVFFSLADGRGFYAEPMVAEMIKAKGLKPGQPFAICKNEVKNGAKKTIGWEVKPVYGANDDPGVTPKVSAAVTTPASGGASPARTVAASSPEDATRLQQTHGNTVLALGMQCVDAMAAIEKYAQQKFGTSFEFNGEDVRATLNTLLIEEFKRAAWRSN